jgi:hypothetical protein
MARSRNSFLVSIVVLALLIFVALNPGSADFNAWQSAQAEGTILAGETQAGSLGTLASGQGKAGEEPSGSVETGFKRRDYYLFSTYSLRNDSYLGVAHFFIKLK